MGLEPLSNMLLTGTMFELVSLLAPSTHPSLYSGQKLGIEVSHGRNFP